MPSRERSYRVEAVVLRHTDWGEADRLLVIYTRELGKLRVVAKGARRLRSRKAGHLEPFTRVQLQLARARDMPIVTQAETVDAYLPLRDDLLRTGYASYIIELLDRFTFEEGENRPLYRLLVESLERLSKGVDPFSTLRYYEIRLLDLLGFRPELTFCVQGQEEIQAQDQYFSAVQGGVLCPRCGPSAADARPVSVSALRFLRHFQRSTFEEAVRLHVSTPVQLEVEALLGHYLNVLLERTLNTPNFLRMLRQAPSPGEETVDR
jgi:DNA repair protein RecO (recombination protein O)